MLGDQVRFDAGHKRDAFLVDVLGRHVEWVPVCPEVEIGLGTPRESLHLEGTAQHPRLVAINTRQDHTEKMAHFSQRRLQELEALDLSGYVFKKHSPSCGVERIRIYNDHGMPSRNAVGVFARAFIEHFPLIPVEEEGRLCDPLLRENFIERVFCYRRWRDLVLAQPSRKAVVEFHTIHKYLLLAHSKRHYEELGRLAANVHRYHPQDLADRYGTTFMEALAVKATVRKHVTVLQHIAGHLKNLLAEKERQALQSVIADYRKELVPLIVPLVLIKHYVQVFDVPYARDQVYLSPHPKELMLRNRV